MACFLNRITDFSVKSVLHFATRVRRTPLRMNGLYCRGKVFIIASFTVHANDPVFNIALFMAKILLAFCCASSLFQIALSSVDRITKRIGDLAFQLVNGTIDGQNAETGEPPDTTEYYSKMDYKIVMRLALNDAENRNRLVKINVRGKLVPRPTRSSADSSAEELARILNLDIGCKVHLYASDHLRFSILMTMLNLPICYDLLDISSAGPSEIARLPLEFFKRPNWDSSISMLKTISVINLLADDELKVNMAAGTIKQRYSVMFYPSTCLLISTYQKVAFSQSESHFGD